ncbi:MAG: glutathionylspermidine synthase family protein [Deltaproteobacteria bacterium]|nr:glutathionylspermidine synthase family protein [Deltaproteobacteria bacterium]
MNAPMEVRAVGGREPDGDEALVRELATRFLLWDTFVAGESRVSLHPLVLSLELHRKAVRAAERVTRAIREVGLRAHGDRAESELYGFHSDVVRLARASHDAGDSASLVRVDLLLDASQHWRACEINADCPGGHNEALALPRLCRRDGFPPGMDPTHVVGALASRLRALARRRDGSDGVVAMIFATAYAEDLQVCALVKQAVEALGPRAVLAPPTAPKLQDGRLWVGSNAIDALYRFFPTEYMEEQANVGAIEEAVARGTVRTLSSFSHMYSQSKLSLARAWALRGCLDEETREAVEATIPETFDAAEVGEKTLLRDQSAWVVKRALGRVGDEVFVGTVVEPDEWEAAVKEVMRRSRGGERWIAQRFVPQSRVRTPWGEMLATLGAYVLDGRFVGYFARVTPVSHVSHDALCVPVFVEAA